MREQSDRLLNLYKIDGGIGKNIAFTSLIPSIIKREGSICIESAYPEVFIGQQGVTMIYSSIEPKDPRKFYSHFKNIYAWDPYIGNMWKPDIHLVDAWATMLNLDVDSKKLYPNVSVDISDDEKKQIDEILGEDEFFVIQISGGQSPYDIKDKDNIPQYENNQMRAGRNFGVIDPLVAELKEKFPDCKMIQFGLPNEPAIKDAERLGLNYVQWMYVFRKAKFFVGIDSMMQHYMAGIKKPGIVFWEMNTPEQFGWKYPGVSHYSSVLPNGVHVDPITAKKAVSTLADYLAPKAG